MLVESDVQEITDQKITDSASRFGYFIFASHNYEMIKSYLPKERRE